MEILEVNDNKKIYGPSVILGDEQENMIYFILS